jgi:Ribbon-helix-helix protein, copG family
MARAIKTTVYLDEEAYARIKDIARAEGRLPAELVREALAEFAARKRPRRLPKSVGAGHSRKVDLSERAEELLAGMGRTRQ